MSDTSTNYLCLCPFHDNTHSPAFSISKEEGLWSCLNPACGEASNLPMLVRKLTGKNHWEALRFIGTQDKIEPIEIKQDIFEKKIEPWHPELVEKFKAALPGSPGEDYMLNRGFTKETLEYFEIGYDPDSRINKYVTKPVVTVPVHWYNGTLVGVVGRTIEGKIFKNSKQLPKNETLFNLNRARRTGSTVIVVEASFDAMYLHQLGHPNAIAFLGGSCSDNHIALLDRHFDEIILMTDFDEKEYKSKCKCKTICTGHRPGRELAYKIRRGLRHKNIRWATYDTMQVYPHGAKDPLDMSPNEIEQCLEDAMTDFEYQEAFGPKA